MSALTFYQAAKKDLTPQTQGKCLSNLLPLSLDSLPRVSVQLQQSCCCVVASSSWRQQSRQRPPASKMAWAGHMVQLAGPGPRHSRQEVSQSSQAWPEPWWATGAETDNERPTYPDTEPPILRLQICKTSISKKDWMEVLLCLSAQPIEAASQHDLFWNHYTIIIFNLLFEISPGEVNLKCIIWHLGPKH